MLTNHKIIVCTPRCFHVSGIKYKPWKILPMDNHLFNTHILSLLQKYIDNQCSEHELQILLAWLKSPEHTDNFDIVSETLWDKLNNKYTYPEAGRMAELNSEVDILLQKMKSGTTPVKSRNIPRRNFFYQAASVFLLLISVGMGYLLLTDKDKPLEITYTEISAGRGEIREYTLADGSQISLNSESTLRIPSDFNQENRIIEMVGEAFFDVTPNTQKPFIIKSGETRVKVLGTSFNVKAYPEDTSIGVTVSTGKVLVNIPDIDLQVRVLPMEHLVIDKTTNSLRKNLFSENNHTKWLEGTLYFDKEPLSEVIKIINRKYDRRVIVQCNDCNPLFSGTHDNKSLEAVIEAICFTTGLKSREEGNTIILYD